MDSLFHYCFLRVWTARAAPEETENGSTNRSGEGGDEGASPSDPSTDLVSNATPREEAALRRVRRVSRLLDEAIRMPGTDFRVGLDPVLGIVPGAGDTVAAAISLYPVAEAYRLGASRGTLAKMLVLVVVDAAVGSIPVVGPVFDAFWKANEWNVRALERHVQQA